MLMYVIALLCATAPGPETLSAGESEAIRPGSAQVRSDHLKPFSARYVMKRGGEPWGKAELNLSSIVIDGEPAWRLAYALYFTNQTVFDEMLLDGATLAPLLKFIHGGLPPDLAYRMYVYGPDRLVGSTVFASGKGSESVSAEVARDQAFALGSEFLVLAGLELSPGGKIAVAAADDSGLRENHIEAIAQDTVRVAGRDFPCLRVSVHGGMMEEWIATEPPYVLRKHSEGMGIEWTLTQVRSN